MQEPDDRYRLRDDFVSQQQPRRKVTHTYRGPSNSREEFHNSANVINLPPTKPSRHVTFSQSDNDQRHHHHGGEKAPSTKGCLDHHTHGRSVLRGGGHGVVGAPEYRGSHQWPTSAVGTYQSGLPLHGNTVGSGPGHHAARPSTSGRERGWHLERPEERESSRDSEEPFMDGNYFFNHLVRERAAENYNVAAVLRERDRDWRKHTQFRGRAAFTAIGADRNIDRLSTSLPVGCAAAFSRPPGYYYYHPRVAAHDAHLGLPVLDMVAPLTPVASMAGGDGGAHLPMPGEVHFADGLEIEIPPRRHAGLGGGGMLHTLRESLSADHLLMVPNTRQADEVDSATQGTAAHFGRGYFWPAESTSNLKQSPPSLLSSQNPTSSADLSNHSAELSNNPSANLASQGRRPVRQEQSQVANSDKPLLTKEQKQSEHGDDGRSGFFSQNHKQQSRLSPPFSQSPSPPTQKPVFNSYNVRTGQFQPDPEMQLPPPKPPPKCEDVGLQNTSRGHVNMGADDDDDDEGSSEMIGWRRRSITPTNNPYGGQYRIRDETAASSEWGNIRRRRVIVPQPSPQLTKFTSAANVRYQQPYGVDGALRGYPPDHRLSISCDQASTAYATSTQGPPFHPTQSGRRQDPAGDVASRKVVTWEDQTERPFMSQLAEQGLESPRHLVDGDDGNFHDNLVFAVEHSDAKSNSNNNTINNTVASSTDNTGSITREALSYPINLSLSRSLLINDLENVDQFALFEVSTSNLCWAESFTGASWLDKTNQYKFVVLNRQEEVLFIGIEEDGAISNCIISPHKSSFKVRILDANGQDVIHFRRLYPVKTKTNFSYGQKNKYRLEVVTPSGHVIGNVEKTYDSDTYYILEDRAGECLFLVQRSCICTCPLFWDYEFKILLPDNEEEVGDISWSYLTCQNEQFNGTEISFPIELNTTSKIMLLGVCFLLNFSRWQSSYLDSLYNPRRRRGKGAEARADTRVNQEMYAQLATSPGDGDPARHPARLRNVVTGIGTR